MSKIKFGPHKALTLLELIIVLVILSILLTMGIAKMVTIAQDARVATEMETIRTIRHGLSVYPVEALSKGIEPGFPATLDNAPESSHASGENPFFHEILRYPGVTDEAWEKISTYTYLSPSGKRYTYYNDNGSFSEVE